MQIVQNGIPRPEFLAFNAYFYQGLNFGNIRGFLMVCIARLKLVPLRMHWERSLPLRVSVTGCRCYLFRTVC